MMSIMNQKMCTNFFFIVSCFFMSSNSIGGSIIEPTGNICELPIDNGTCGASMPRFGYNNKTGQCESFIYGGCEGNANNFITQDKCENKCEGEFCVEGSTWKEVCNSCICENGLATCTIAACSLENICELPIDKGTCEANIPRFGYSNKSGQCESFIYGGCEGNGNNFITQEDCENSCEGEFCIEGSTWTEECNSCSCINGSAFCTLVECSTGQSCVEGSAWMEECNSCSCQNGVGTCTEIHCPPENPCELPFDKGSCEAQKSRFGYNKMSGQCESFIYGGCEGNANNFITIEECENSCKENPCNLPFVTGPCRALMGRYGYNKTSGQCELFIYGGCGGNANKFVTIEECENQCKDVCKKEVVTGPCYGSFQRYAYNKTSGQCEKFTYGGCDGNGNNFSVEKHCEDECEAGCDKPIDSGLCYAYFERYAYNQTSWLCQKFIYGGCGGNGNNYFTIEECEAECEKSKK